eukprot:CAMPEP_0117514628 /NCGR_PEP_ID=MMETSP0784-20121206/30166_1 /TAXON_ID=39447 /ORGANISM="" /LENGTH=450 /DNA_ID=CAMNT_0005310427 /DNA_START=50 /DNA_END=1402 /DNA_ORIENTATION=-
MLMVMRSLACASFAVWHAATEVCSPTACFGGDCPGENVTLNRSIFHVKVWNGKSYSDTVGTVDAYAMAHSDFGIFLHGPLFRPAQQQLADFAPPLYIVGSLTDKIFRLDNFRKNESTLSASKHFVAWSAAPSTLYPIKPGRLGGPERFLVAEGNPFVVNPGNHSMQFWMGGVELVDEEKCTTIFPTGVDAITGKVINTVECHASGICFFSQWKFYDDSLPLGNNDCLYWCRVADLDNPSECMDSGIMVNVLGNQICHVDGRGAVHGLKIGKDDAEEDGVFDLFLFTGKPTFDEGDSSIFKLKVKISLLPEGKGAVETIATSAWGTDLWQNSVAQPHSVGVDHAWIDDSGEYVWVGTFRQQSDGVHMLEYDSGKLVHSIFGVADLFPGKYVYTSGLHGIGAWGKKGSVLAVATCMEFGQQFLGGTSFVVLIDLSSMVPGRSSNTSASVLVI